MRERIKMAKDPKYLNCVYKCTDCIKGFVFKESYDNHMEKHSKAMGKYKCDICNQRMATMNRLLSHQRYHRVRYKCSECNLTRTSRLTIKEHYSAYHHQDPYLHECLHCHKMFKRQISLKKHIKFTHMTQKRSKCEICQKTYVNKEGLKTHMIDKHPSEATAGTIKKHVCPDCGVAFKAPSQLRSHMVKHTGARNYYCVECDKGFKSNNSLKQHLKIAAPHVNYLELPLKCDHCDKRFSVRRDLVRHSNRVHLNIKPFQCDKCDKAYVNLWSLTEHKRFTHEGHRRPLNFPCPFCDKVFSRNATRKSHIRTHTGERPFACNSCPAKFSQAGVLATHVKLVHLKLTRDGRPKEVPILPH
ncbi:zinc finger protein 501-like [Melitaea cinxia]|uniref:zinc finger protein 501-like n=1 Tax=Melitaea cinxia TaxID=113334 RepID=UPI001E2739D3|nr:zinc finger protein 501-like [Melitaea cinxia]